MQTIGPTFGNGKDGNLVISSNTTDAPIDSSCSGTAGSVSLSATNASFAAGQAIFIHQTRGTGAGNGEFNKIASYTAGTITVDIPLKNTYTDSGASQAQVLVVEQYSSVTIDASRTLTAKAWDGNVGGLVVYICSGIFTVNGVISGNGKGYRGGAGGSGDPEIATQGESATAAGTTSKSANGAGGGGGAKTSGDYQPGGGGGGGNGAVGTAGTDKGGGNDAGAAGATDGGATLVDFVLGAGGGGGGGKTSGGAGGAGGSGIIIFAKELVVHSSTGSITANGATGSNGIPTETEDGGGGGGSGGSILIQTRTSTVNTNRITATAGSGGTGNTNGGNGGAGGVGRIRIESCSRSGSTNPAASESIGGNNWCGRVGLIN